MVPELQPVTLEAVATPGNAPHLYLVMSAFGLESLQPGKYTLEMTVEDKVWSDRATEFKEFTLQ